MKHHGTPSQLLSAHPLYRRYRRLNAPCPSARDISTFPVVRLLSQDSCDRVPVTRPLYLPYPQLCPCSILTCSKTQRAGSAFGMVQFMYERVLRTSASCLRVRPPAYHPPLLLPNEFGRKVTLMTIRMTTKRRLITYRLITYLLVTFGLTWGLWHAPITMMGHNYGRGYPGFPFTGIFVWSCSAQVFRYASRICA